MLAEIQEKDPSYTMPTCSIVNDLWQLANDYCNKVQNGAHLPSTSDLAKIARVLYNDNSISDAYELNSGLNWVANKAAVFSALGIEDTGSSTFDLWSSTYYGDISAYFLEFSRQDTIYTTEYRLVDSFLAVCIGN